MKNNKHKIKNKTTLKSDILLLLFMVGLSTLGWSQIEGDFSPLTRTSDVKLRFATYNVYFGSVFPKDDGTPAGNVIGKDRAKRIEKFRRLALAVNADIWACQEVFNYPEVFLEKTPAGLKTYMESILGGTWHISHDYVYNPATPEIEGTGGRFLFSRYPILHEERSGGRSRATLIDLPASVSDKNLLVINAHLQKDNHGKEVGDFIADVIAGNNANIPSDVMIMATGDWNAEPGSTRYNVAMAADGNAGANYTPVMDDLAPTHMGWGEEVTYTIGGVQFDGSGTPIGIDKRTIDFMMWKSDDLDVKHSYVVNTLIMDQSALDEYGLQATDVALDALSIGTKTGIGCDHFPYFADLIEESLEICSSPYEPNNKIINNSALNWSSGDVDISCATDITISMDIEGVDAGTMESADYLNIYYKIDGGTKQELSLNTDGFAKKTVSITELNGDSVEIIIEALNDAADEFYYVNNININGTVAAPTYSLNVIGGSPDADYETGEVVSITANDAANGYVFLKWEMTSGNPMVADLTDPTTTMTMPAGDVTLTAIYKMEGCELPYTDVNKTINKGTLNWSSDAIDMTCASTVTISMDIEGKDEASLEPNDYLNVYYKVDGGAKQELSLNTGDFVKKTISKSGITGSNIELIIESSNSANDEYYYITNILIEESTLSVNSFDAVKSFKMYPNPATTEIYLDIAASKSSQINVTFFDILGQVLSQPIGSQVINPGKHNFRIPVEDLETGIYFAKITMNQTTWTKKIVIE